MKIIGKTTQIILKNENINAIVNVIKFGYFMKSTIGEYKILSIMEP
jgi:hypothetical protein